MERRCLIEDIHKGVHSRSLNSRPKNALPDAVGCIGAAVVLGDVNWPMVASAAVLAAVVSLLTSVAGLPEVEKETANKN